MKQFVWADFFRRTKNNPHWALLERAASLAGHKGHALDLGCGAGRDTRYLLAQEWYVTAVDREPGAIAALAELPQQNLQVVQSSFEDFVFEHDAYDLVNAQFSLPFIPKASFGAVLTRLKQSIKPGGIFTGQFFGIRDEWNTPENDMTFVTREQVNELLSDLQVIEFMEEDRMGQTALGVLKHWHVFHVIAQKSTV
jgi:tellurite methyltransferase